jgi:hypothetical protein
MSDGNNNPMKRGPTAISDTTDSVEKRQKVHDSSEDANRQTQSQKLVQDFMASLETSAGNREAGEEEKPSSLSDKEKKDRKREINRLSAQRKRVRERVQLDTLTDRYAQLSYRNEALKADNDRLNKLISSLKGTLSEAKQQDSSASASQQQQFDRGVYLVEKLGLVEKVRQSLLASVQEGQPARLNSLDPATGSAAGSTTENPFEKTTNLLIAKVKVVDHTRQTLITVLHSVQQAQAPSSAGVNVGNAFPAVVANQTAPKQWPVAQENPFSLHSQLLSALRAPAPPPPPPPPPTAAAAPNAMVLLQLLAALGGSTGNAQPSQIPNRNVVSDYQRFQGAPSNSSQPASMPGAFPVCTQPTQASGSGMMRSPPTPGLSSASNSTHPHHVIATNIISSPSVVASSTTRTSQAPVGGSANNAQVASLAALLQLLQNKQGQQG